MTETTPYLTRLRILICARQCDDPFTVVPQVLDLVRLNGAIFFRSDFRAPWGYTSPPVQELAGALPHAPGSLVLFHIIAESHCWIAMDGVRRSLSLVMCGDALRRRSRLRIRRIRRAGVHYDTAAPAALDRVSAHRPRRQW